MRELRSFVGLSPSEFHKLLGQKRALIWGGNGACSEVVAALSGMYGVASGDVLTMVTVGFRQFSGFSVHRPDAYLASQTVHPDTHLVIVASMGYRKEIVRQLESAGFIKGQHYLFSHEIFRQRVIIRIVDAPQIGEQALNVVDLTNFLEKNTAVLRGATLEISGFPDPFSHSGIEELARAASDQFLTTITSHLPNSQLTSLAKRYPIRLRLLVFPDLATLHRHFPTATMYDEDEYFESVLNLLYEASDECPVELVKVAFPAQHSAAAKFPARPNIIYSTDRAYPVDFAPILQAAERSDVAQLARQQALCDFDLTETLLKAREQQDKPCMCERVYPVLNADASWAVCHLHFEGILCEKSASADYAQVLAQRRCNAYCETCQRHGLHRLDVNLLG